MTATSDAPDAADEPDASGAGGAAEPTAGSSPAPPAGRWADLPGDEVSPLRRERAGRPEPEGRRPRRLRALRAELLAALEIGALTGLAFTRPVLDSYGQAPETFLVRGAGRFDVVLFGLAVTLLPAVAVAGVAAASRLGGWRVRRWVHVVLVGLLAGVVAWRFGADVASWGARRLAVAGVVGGVAVAAVRYRLPSTATFLRFAGAASAVFLLQFLLVSPSSQLVLGGDEPGTRPEFTEAVLAATDGDPPPVVVLVVDALPTSHLVDGDGRIDADLYPNLAALAGDGTWYRNYTTVSGWTYQALPALFTGQLPSQPQALPDAGTYPDNLFTLLAGTHDMEAVEQITRLCPAEACPPDDSGALPSLLGDSVDWWRGALEREEQGGARILPGALAPDRADDFTAWIDRQDFSPGDRPDLWFYHLVMPHEPWVVLDDLSPYTALDEAPYGLYLNGWWDEVGAEVGQQRQVLQTQAVDRAIGLLLDELRAAGTYDDTLVVVTGDHGQAFTDEAPLRGLAPEQFEQVAWTPLIVKEPGQTEGAVDDTNLWTIDLVPTIADILGVELPWDADGVPARRAAEARDEADKRVLDHEFHEIEPPAGSDFVRLDGREGLDRVTDADPVPGTGEDAVWQRTGHGPLVGQPVDELDVGPGDDGTIRVEQLDRIERQGDGPPLIELVGHTGLPEGEAVAVAVNGVVTGVAPVATNGGDALVHALLLPDPFAASNDVTAYRVQGEPGAETLHPLEVAPR